MMRFNLLRNIVPIVFVALLVSCSRSPRPIAYDTDACDFCRMTISDARFGGELVTKKGRVYKFDDLHCMKAFLQEQTIPSDDIHSLWLVDFEEKGKFIPAETGFLLRSDELQSPMGSNAVAFGNEDVLKDYQTKHHGEVLQWQDFLNIK